MTIIGDIINAYLTVLFSSIFCSLFAKDRFHKAWKAIALGIFTVIFTVVLQCSNPGIVRFITLASITLAVTCFFSIKFIHRLLYTAILIALSSAFEVITAISVSMLFNIDMTAGTEGPFYILGTLISKMLVLITIIFIRLGKHRSIRNISVKHVLTLSLVPISSLLLLVLQFLYAKDLPTNTIWLFVVAYLLLILSNIVIFDYVDSLYQNNFYKEKLDATIQIIQEQEKQYIAIQRHYNDIAKFKHDQKNINIAILNELNEGKIKDVQEHLQDQIEFLSTPSIRNTGIIHSVIDIKKEWAESLGIRMIFDYNGIGRIKISDIDIAVLLGNALDNAIEATTKVSKAEKEIELSVTMHNNNLLIYVKNPVEKAVDITRLNTTKTNTKHHGFGVESMKHIVENFQGTLIFNCSDGYFEVTAVLPNIIFDTPNND